MDKALQHPLRWWQFYAACLRYAGTGVLGVIGDAGTILGIVVLASKQAWPQHYAMAAAYLKARGYREDALIEIPLWIGAAILAARLVAAPFSIYRAKPSDKEQAQPDLAAVLATTLRFTNASE